MRNNDVKKLTQGAMLSGIIGVIMLLNTLSSMTLITTIPYLLPIPFVIYTKQFGYQAGIVMLVVSSIIGILVTPFHQVIILIAYGLIGIVYGQGAKIGIKDKFLIFSTFIGSLFFQMMMIFVFSGIYGIDFINEIKEMTKIITDFFSYSPELLELAKSMIRPALILSYILYSFCEAFVIYMLSEMISKSLKLKPVEIIKFTDIRYSPFLAVIAAMMILGGMYLNKYPQFGINPDLMLFIAICGFVYLGFIGYIYFFSKKSLRKFLLLNTMLLLLTLRFYCPIHVGIGLLTSLNNYWRKPHESTI